MATEECLLSEGRNPHLSEKEIEKRLYVYLNCTKWIPRGIYNNETNGHVDNMCNFFCPGVVVLAWTNDKKGPQYERNLEAYNYLSKQTDAKGRKLEIHKLLTPSSILITKRESQGIDAVDRILPKPEGDRMAASYVIYFTENSFVTLPIFNNKNDDNAVKY